MWVFLVCQDKVSLCSPGCPRTQCRPGWPPTQRSACLYLPSAGIKGAKPESSVYKISKSRKCCIGRKLARQRYFLALAIDLSVSCFPGRASPLLLSSAPATDPTDAITRQREEELKLIDQLRKVCAFSLPCTLRCRCYSPYPFGHMPTWPPLP